MECFQPVSPYEIDGLLRHVLPYDNVSSLPPDLASVSSPPPQDIFDIVMRRCVEKFPPIPTPVYSFLDQQKPSPPDDIPSTPSLLPFRYGCTPPYQSPEIKYAAYVPPPIHERRPIPSVPKRKAFTKPKICEIQPWKMPRAQSSFEETVRLALRRASETVSPFIKRETTRVAHCAHSLQTIGINFLTRLDQIKDGASLLRENLSDPITLSFDSIIPLFESTNRIRLQPSNLSQNTSLHIFGDTLIQTLQLGKDHATAYVWEKNHPPFSITFPIDGKVEDGYIEDATILSALYGSETNEPIDRLPVTVKDADLSEFGISQVLTNYIQKTIPILALEGAHLPSLEREQILAQKMLRMLPFFVEEKAPARRIEKRVMPRRTLADLFSSSYTLHRQTVTAVA